MRVISEDSAFGFAVVHCLLEVVHTPLFASAFLPTNQQSFEPVNMFISLSAPPKTAFDELTICSC